MMLEVLILRQLVIRLNKCGGVITQHAIRINYAQGPNSCCNSEEGARYIFKESNHAKSKLDIIAIISSSDLSVYGRFTDTVSG